MATTLKLVDTIEFCQPYIGNMPLAVGATMQPFLGIANAVAGTMLSPPFKWSFNRSSIDFLSVASTQNYRNAGSWASNTVYAVGTVIIDPNGNGQKVTQGGTSGGSTPSWSTGMFTSTTDNGVTWMNVGALASIPKITNFGFVDKAQIQDVNNNSEWKELQVKLDLSRAAQISCPKFIAAQSDDNLGDITFRLMPVPGSAYPVSVNYQQAQKPFTQLSNLWSPFPDRLFYVYSFGCLALAYLYAEDPRFQMAQQQFISRLVAQAEGLTETEINIFLSNWNALTGTTAGYNMRLSQGIQARQVGG
jgi:hypothetical protein